MPKFSKMGAFYSQAQQGRNVLTKPEDNLALKGFQSSTGAQQERNKQTERDTTAVQAQFSQDVLSKQAAEAGTNKANAAKVEFSKSPQAQAPNAQFAQSFKPTAYTSIEDVEKAATAQTTGRKAGADALAASMEKASQEGLNKFYNTNLEELTKLEQRDPTQLAANSTVDTNRENFVNALATTPATSNVGLLRQMYLLDPKNAALESQVRQAEMNQLKGQAQGALVDQSTARGSGEVARKFYGQAVTESKDILGEARKAEEDRLKQQVDAIRNDPSMSVEAKNKLIDDFKDKIDKLRNTEVVNVVSAIPPLNDAAALDAAVSKVDDLISKGFTIDELKQRMRANGVSEETANLLLNKDLQAAKKSQWAEAIKAEQLRIENEQRDQQLAEARMKAPSMGERIVEGMYDASMLPVDALAWTVDKMDMVDGPIENLSENLSHKKEQGKRKLKEWFS